MAIWRYIKGTEADFKGAPDWATLLMRDCGELVWIEAERIGARAWYFGSDKVSHITKESDCTQTVLQRERVTSVNDDRLQTTVDKFAHLNDLPLVSEKYPSHDNVNHPPHYTQGGIECIDALRAATVGKSGIEAVCVANVIKYLWRYEVKGGLESIEKAQWYLNHLLEVKRGV